MSKKYTLVGVDGNAFSVMGYTAKALRATGHHDLEEQMYNEAQEGDYDHLLQVCLRYLDIANKDLPEEDDNEAEDEE